MFQQGRYIASTVFKIYINATLGVVVKGGPQYILEVSHVRDSNYIIRRLHEEH